MNDDTQNPIAPVADDSVSTEETSETDAPEVEAPAAPAEENTDSGSDA